MAVAGPLAQVTSTSLIKSPPPLYSSGKLAIPYPSIQVTFDRRMVTLGAFTRTQPRDVLAPSSTWPRVVRVTPPLTTVSATPAGTPVFVASG